MLIQLIQPIGFSQIGGRSNNEDSIFPPEDEATTTTQLFLVCDGMGGYSNGEVASKIAATGFAQYLSLNPTLNKPNSISEIYSKWDSALVEVENRFEEYIEAHPESQGMGTTLCLLHINSMGVLLGHVGDSRIYQVRQNQIVFKSEDHSLVNEKVKRGEITAEEAVNFPGRNIITRAIQGAKSPTIIEYKLLKDIQKGDYFFICTDGVLEQINDRILIEILTTPDFSCQEKVNAIVEKCQNITKDNYSGYLIEIGEVENDVQPIIPATNVLIDNADSNDLLIRTVEPPKAVVQPTQKTKTQFWRKSRDILVGLAYAFGGLIVFFLAWIAYDEFTKKKEPETPTTTRPRHHTPRPEKTVNTAPTVVVKKDVSQKTKYKSQNEINKKTGG